MKIKALHIVSAVSFIAIVQLLFFWLISTESKAFVALYPFYTVLTTAHAALLTFIRAKYKYPASFAPTFSGGIVTVGEIVVGLLLGLFCDSIRTIIFVQSIITVVYILVMAVFCSIASRESVDSETLVAPIRPYSTNSEPSVIASNTSRKRTPKASANNTNR